MESKLTPELIAKAKQAKSAEEILTLAKENGIELSEEEAKAHFERLHNSGEISDEELDNVSGGGCVIFDRSADKRPTVNPGCNCGLYKCKKCGAEPVPTRFGQKHSCIGSDQVSECETCQYGSKEGSQMFCNNPNNSKR